MPFSRDLPDPGIKPRSPALQVDSLLTKPLGKPMCAIIKYLSPFLGYKFHNNRDHNCFTHYLTQLGIESVFNKWFLSLWVNKSYDSCKPNPKATITSYTRCKTKPRNILIVWWECDVNTNWSSPGPYLKKSFGKINLIWWTKQNESFTCIIQKT